jgi:hypothetical protein
MDSLEKTAGQNSCATGRVAFVPVGPEQDAPLAYVLLHGPQLPTRQYGRQSASSACPAPRAWWHMAINIQSAADQTTLNFGSGFGRGDRTGAKDYGARRPLDHQVVVVGRIV